MCLTRNGATILIFMKHIFLILFLYPALTLAQTIENYPRDTSYTINNAYKKVAKKYPFVEVAKAEIPKGVAKEAEIVYKDLEGRSLKLDVFYPAKESRKSLPAVLLIHGGGWRTGDRSLMYPMAAQLAAKGFVTVTAEYRLSLEAPFPAAVHDLKTAIKWIRANAKKYKVDTAKIAVLGCSAGGQLAALIGTTNGEKKFDGDSEYNHSSEVQAILDIDGILAFHHPESEEGTMAGQWLGGSYEEVPETWQKAAALTHADENMPPVLFIGSSFPRFLAGKNDMIKILEKNKIYYESYTFPDSPHGFWLYHPWFEPTLEYVTEFLEEVFNNS